MSFYHNVFAREHNAFVDEFRRAGGADAGRRLAACAIPPSPTRVIRYKDVTPDELFEAARLVVAAEIAKIHTIEWTPQLLYDEPLYRGMNANWSGLLGDGDSRRRRSARADRGHRISANRPTSRKRRSGIRSSPRDRASSGWAARSCDDRFD